MNATRTTRRRLALVAGFALATSAGFSSIQVAAADEPAATRKAGVVLTRANVDVNTDCGRCSVYATTAHGGTITGAADPGRAVFSRPDPKRTRQ